MGSVEEQPLGEQRVAEQLTETPGHMGFAGGTFKDKLRGMLNWRLGASLGVTALGIGLCAVAPSAGFVSSSDVDNIQSALTGPGIIAVNTMALMVSGLDSEVARNRGVGLLGVAREEGFLAATGAALKAVGRHMTGGTAIDSARLAPR